MRELNKNARHIVLSIDLCAAYVPREVWIDPGSETSTVHVIVGDGALDLAHSWNKGALSPEVDHGRARDVFWLPDVALENDDVFVQLSEWIQKSVRSDRGSASGVVTSYSIDVAKLALVAEKLSKATRVRFEPRNLRPEQFPMPKWGARRQERPSNTVVVPDGAPDYMVATARPSFLPAATREQGQWMQDVLIGFRPSQYAAYTTSRPGWCLPKHPNLPDRFFPSSMARITGQGLLSVPTSTASSDVTLQIPSDESVVAAWFSRVHPGRYNRGAFGEPHFEGFKSSDKGYALNGVTARFGSLFHAAWAADDPYWRPVLLELAGKPRDEQRADNVQVVVNDFLATSGGTIAAGSTAVGELAGELVRSSVLLHGEQPERSLDWFSQRFYKLRSEAKQTGVGVQMWPDGEKWDERRRDELEGYLEDGVIWRGVSVKCEVCGRHSWRDVDRLANRVTCELCTAQFPLPLSLEWSFRLNPLVADGISKQGMLAQLQALNTLERMARGMFLWLAPVDVIKTNSSEVVTDLDLVVIRDKEFIIGEVKSSAGGFKAKDFEKLRHVAERIRPNRVILAAPGRRPLAEVAAQVEELGIALKPLGIEVEYLGLEGS